MRIKFCAKWMVALAVACSAAVAPAFAGPIGIGDFSGGETVTTFEGLGLPTVGNPTPIAFGGNTYVTDNGLLRYFLGAICSSSCIGTDTDAGFIDVTLGVPATRAGARVGLDLTPWSGIVEFYDLVNALLGTVTFTNEPAGMQFAGWESAGGIGRMRVIDGFPQDFSAIAIDDFRFENASLEVPEPSGMALFGLGGLLLFASTRRRGKS